MWKWSSTVIAAVCLTGCVVERPVPVYEPSFEPAPVRRPVYSPPPEVAPQTVISVVVEPPISQPPAIAVPWAPPPMLVEVPPPPPPGAVWVGGYWVWQGTWVWAHGYWAVPPQPNYHWVAPYYEHRDGTVIFIAAHWAAPGVVFVPPPLGIHIALAVVRADALPGPRPIGPQGVFVPAPPGSRPGLIVPAPIGTPPAVVVSAPPVVNVGMRVQAEVNGNNTTLIKNITNVTNITHVTVVAPPSATANGQAVRTSVPAQAHLAAALPPVVRAFAPPPVSRQPVPAWTPGRPLPVLPRPIATSPHPMEAHVAAPPPERAMTWSATEPLAPAAVSSPRPEPTARTSRPVDQTARPPQEQRVVKAGDWQEPRNAGNQARVPRPLQREAVPVPSQASSASREEQRAEHAAEHEGAAEHAKGREPRRPTERE